MQREHRKQFEAMGTPWEPRWFKLQQDKYADPTLIPTDDGIPVSWKFGGDYWQARETGQWPSDQFDIW